VPKRIERRRASIDEDGRMNLDEVADELYGAEPEQFVELRKARAADARAAGDRDLAKKITALRRPTRSAWVVNLLSGQARKELTELLDLGAALAEAQQRLSAKELRELSGQRHAAIAALVRRGSQLAEVHGHTATEATLREVSDTLQAALSDPAVAEVVRKGHLTQAQEYGGFGPQFGFAAAPVGGSARSSSADGDDATAGADHGSGTDAKTDAEADGKVAGRTSRASTGSGRSDADHEDAGRPDRDQEAADQAAADAERDRMIDRLNTAQQALDRIRDQARRTAEQLEKATDIAAQRSERVEQLREQLARAEREADKAADDRDRLQHQAEELRKAQNSAEDAVSDALSRLAGS
jgi:hypothetical protein